MDNLSHSPRKIRKTIGLATASPVTMASSSTSSSSISSSISPISTNTHMESCSPSTSTGSSISSEDQNPDDVNQSFRAELGPSCAKVISASSVLGRKNKQKSLTSSPFWKFYKPRFEDTLYYGIFHDPKEEMITDLAKNCLNLYKENNQLAMLKLYKLFLDMTGGDQSFHLNNFDFKNFQKSCENVSTQIDRNQFYEPQYYAEELGNGVKTSSRLPQEMHKLDTAFGKIMTCAIQHFLDALIYHALIENVYEQLLVDIYKFLTTCLMKTSIKVSPGYVSMILLRNILTTLVQIYLANLRNAQTRRIVEKLIKIYLTQFAKYSTEVLYEKHMQEAHFLNITAMSGWMTNSSGLLAQMLFKNCLEYITKNTLDANKKVGNHAVDVLIELIGDENKKNRIKGSIHQICTNFNVMLEDKSDAFLKHVVQLGQAIFANFRNDISKELLREISYTLKMTLMSARYERAKISAQFLIEHGFISKSEVGNLNELIEFCQEWMKYGTHVKGRIVESFVETDFVLNNFEKIFEIVKKNCFHEEFTSSLMELTYESVHIRFKGEPTVKTRATGYPTIPQSKEDQVKFAGKLFQLWQFVVDNSRALTYSILMISMVDAEVLEEHYLMHIVPFCRILLGVFQRCFYDEELLRSISCLLGKIQIKCKHLESDFKELLDEFFENINKNIDFDMGKRLGIMYEYVDLTKYYTWESFIYPILDEALNEELVATMIPFASYFAYWTCANSKHYTGEQLQDKCKEVSKILEHLKNVFIQSDISSKRKAFECICSCLKKIIESRIGEQSNENLEKIVIHLKRIFLRDANFFLELKKFFDKQFVGNKSIPREERMKYVTLWFHVGASYSPLLLTPIFRHYNEFTEDYLGVVPRYFQHIQVKEPFYKIVFSASTEFASEIVSKKHSDRSWEKLKQLARKFVKIEGFEQFPQFIYEHIVMKGLAFVQENDGMSKFLKVLDIFARVLPDDYRKKFQESLKKF